jgi:hypothetical protein
MTKEYWTQDPERSFDHWGFRQSFARRHSAHVMPLLESEPERVCRTRRVLNLSLWSSPFCWENAAGPGPGN